MLNLVTNNINCKGVFTCVSYFKKWQINDLIVSGNTIISKKNFNLIIAEVYLSLFGENYKEKSCSEERYNICKNSIINSLEVFLNHKVLLKDFPAVYNFEVDCFIIKKL